MSAVPVAEHAVSRSEVEREVLEVLRAFVVDGETARIDPERPLSELGLDSMALLKLLAELEKRFAATFDDDVWGTKSQLTARALVRWLERAGEKAAQKDRASKKVAALPPLAPVSNEARRLLGRALHAAMWRADARNLFRAQRSILLSRDLSRVLPARREVAGLRFEETAASTFVHEAPPWAGTRENLARWAKDGFMLVTAWLGDELAATDWLSPTGDDEASSGLSIRNAEGACFGLGLFENPRLKGRGIGLALAIHSLHFTKERGYRTQTTMVDSKNAPMLTASAHVLGFEKVGHVDTVAVLGRPVSRWTVRGVSGVGGELRL